MGKRPADSDEAQEVGPIGRSGLGDATLGGEGRGEKGRAEGGDSGIEVVVFGLEGPGGASLLETMPGAVARQARGGQASTEEERSQGEVEGRKMCKKVGRRWWW